MRIAGLPDLLFAKGPNIAQKRVKFYDKGPNKEPTIFPNLSAVTKSYEPILSNLLNGSVPRSLITIAAQQQKTT